MIVAAIWKRMNYCLVHAVPFKNWDGKFIDTHYGLNVTIDAAQIAFFITFS